MKYRRDRAESLSDWLLENISMKLVVPIFITVLVIQIGNWLHIDAFPAYSTASRAMDVVWWVDLGFTAVSAGNWFFRKLWETLKELWEDLTRWF